MKEHQFVESRIVPTIPTAALDRPRQLDRRGPQLPTLPHQPHRTVDVRQQVEGSGTMALVMVRELHLPTQALCRLTGVFEIAFLPTPAGGFVPGDEYPRRGGVVDDFVDLIELHVGRVCGVFPAHFQVQRRLSGEDPAEVWLFPSWSLSEVLHQDVYGLEEGSFGIG